MRDDVNGLLALFNAPNSASLDGSGGLFIAETTSNRIRRVATATGAVSTVVGSGVAGATDGFLASATLRGPRSVTILPAALGGTTVTTQTGLPLAIIRNKFI